MLLVNNNNPNQLMMNQDEYNYLYEFQHIFPNFQLHMKKNYLQMDFQYLDLYKLIQSKDF